MSDIVFTVYFNSKDHSSKKAPFVHEQLECESCGNHRFDRAFEDNHFLYLRCHYCHKTFTVSDLVLSSTVIPVENV